MKIRVPSPALVISIIALVVACTATAYAATKITSTTQIKNGVVTGTDVKNRSISGTDIKKNTIKTTNISKSTLKSLGAGGGGGPSYEVTRRAANNHGTNPKNVEIVSLTVPAGTYVVSGKAIQRAFPPPDGLLSPATPLATGNCKLDAAGDIDDSIELIAVNSRAAAGNHGMQITRTVGDGAVFKILCDAGLPWSVSRTTIIAQKVGGVSRTDVP